MSSRLFTPIELSGLQLANRVVVAPMCQYSANEGTMSDWHLAHLGQFAMTGPGLIIIEATGVEAVGRITHGCCGLYSDENEAAMKRVISFCKSVGDSKIGIQLGHAGRKASTERPWEGGNALKSDAWQTCAPSAIAFTDGWHTPKALEDDGLARVKQAFVNAAQRAVRMGIEAIEIHGAHGYLLHQFLSPISNQRTDKYGGSLENRMRYPLEIFDAVKSVVPSDMPILVRVSATDWVEGGWDIDQTIRFAKALDAAECAAIHVSSGGNSLAQKIELGYGYQTDLAKKIRDQVKMPVIAVGMITDPMQAETILRTGQADLIALAREFLRDPHWTWRAAKALRSASSVPDQYGRAMSFD